MKSNYMAEQVKYFPGLDHWEQVFWAVVNEIVDNQERNNSSNDDEWHEFWTDYYGN